MPSTTTPAYRGRLTIFFDGLCSAMNPYPKPWKFRVRRITKGWDGEVWRPSLAKIVLTSEVNDSEVHPQTEREIHAMNPAHIIYECLTNRVWGRGLHRSALDDASFTAAAQTLYNEGFGLCLKWNRQDTIQSFMQAIIDMIGGAMYEDRETGLIRLKLVRADYNFASLPIFDTENGLLSIEEASIASPANMISECIVSYHDPITDKPRKVRAQNIAVVQMSGGVVNTMTKDYIGVPVPELAQRLAQRDLRAASSRLRRYTLTLNRRGWNLYPGDVIRIRDVKRSIPDMAVRIGRYEDGTFQDGRIKVQAIQDVFSLPASSFTGNQGGGWAPPSTNPCEGRQRVFEMPYGLAVRLMTPANFQALTGTGALLACAMEEGQTLNTAYDIAVKQGAAHPSENPPNNSYFCPTYTTN